jgi:hypothetical protein
MVELFNAALNKRVAAKLWKQPLTMRASKSGMSAYETLVQSAAHVCSQISPPSNTHFHRLVGSPCRIGKPRTTRGSRSETLGSRIWILGTRIFSRRELPIKYFLIWYPINLRYLDKAPRKALLFCGIMTPQDRGCFHADKRQCGHRHRVEVWA